MPRPGTSSAQGLGRADPGWQVLAASSIQSRFEALHETSLTPLVGREEELELLLRRWARRSQGEGRVVLLTGEAGVGKSRLIAALQERLQSAACTNTLLLLATTHRQRPISDHQSARTRRRTGARRQREGEARQARCSARADLNLVRGRCALCRDAVACRMMGDIPRSI